MGTPLQARLRPGLVPGAGGACRATCLRSWQSREGMGRELDCSLPTQVQTTPPLPSGS